MTSIGNSHIDPSQAMVYQIRIKGHLGSGWTDWFEGLTITLEENGNTLLTGPVVDQAALHGLLRKVRDVGMPLLSVIRVGPSQAEASIRRSRMNVAQKTAEENSVLQWGGLAGILGSIIFILTFVFVGAFVGLDPDEPADWVTRFPAIRAARTVENSLFLVVLILWVPHFLALYHALRGASLAPALFGSVLGVLGLVVLTAEALPHVAQAPISDLYHAPGATPADQRTLVLLWQATQGTLDAMFIAGLVLLPIGLIVLGVAMLRAPAFGKGFGGMSVVLGMLGVVAASLLLVDPASVLGGMVGVFALIGFHFVLGWKVYRLSRVA